MNTWLIIILVVLSVSALIVGLAFLVSVILLWAGKKAWQKWEKQDAEEVERLLPHTNCGACGFPTCRDFAQSTARERCLSVHCGELDAQQEAEIDALLQERTGQLRERRERDREKNRKKKRPLHGNETE